MSRKQLVLSAGVLTILIIVGISCYLLFSKGTASSDLLSEESASSAPSDVIEPSDRWIDVVREWGFSKDGPSKVGCGVRTEYLTLAKGTPQETTLAVDRQYCPPEYEGSIAFYENRGEYQVTPSEVIVYLDPKYLSADDYEDHRRSGDLGGMTLFNYWILDSKQDTKAFIASLTNEPRCAVYENSSKDNVYLSSPDDRTYTLAPDNEEEMNQVDGVTLFCRPYGVGGGIRFFKRVGNVILYLPIGNEMYPTFDPSSFRIVGR